MGAFAFEKTEFDERCYRFSVRCDRDFNRRIEQAARADGLSVTAFVQRHFETILDEPPDSSGFAPQSFARANGVSDQAARLWRAMRDAAAPDGEITGVPRAFCGAARISQGHASDYLAELTGAGLVSVIARPWAGRAGTYRINQGIS